MKKKIYISVLAVVIISGGIFYWYKKDKSVANSVRYVTESVKKDNLSTTIVASGSIIVDSQETVDPTISGTISDLSVKVGDMVNKGDFLFNVINDELDVSVAQASASYQQSLNSLESAKNNRDSAEAEYRVAKNKDEEDDGAYTGRQLDVLKNKIDLAEGSIIQAQKGLTASAASYRSVISDAGDRKVVSPIDGTIIEVSIKNGDELGSSSNSSSESAIIVGDLTTLKAEIPINEVDIAKVKVGQRVSITLDALADTNFTGEVEKIDSIGESNSGVVSYGVTIKFNELDERIKPTMSVSAVISVSEKKDVLIVPNSAVKNDTNGNYVEILENGAPKKIKIEIGDSNDTSTEIVSGISVGDKVITKTVSSTANSSSSSSSNKKSSSIGIPGIGGGPRD